MPKIVLSILSGRPSVIDYNAFNRKVDYNLTNRTKISFSEELQSPKDILCRTLHTFRKYLFPVSTHEVTLDCKTKKNIWYNIKWSPSIILSYSIRPNIFWRSTKYPFIVITPWFTVAWRGFSCLGANYNSNRSD